MRTIRVLILEDDLETLALIFKKLYSLENELEGKFDFSTVVLSENTMVEEYINKGKKGYDIVLLDRDDKIGGSFHNLDLARFDLSKVISISSVPSYNDEALKKDVARAIWKNYDDLESFAEQVKLEVRKISVAF